MIDGTIEGRWLTPEEAGCSVCGERFRGVDEELRAWFIGHTHDRIDDIAARALSGVAWVPVEDVLYLLDRIVQ